MKQFGLLFVFSLIALNVLSGVIIRDYSWYNIVLTTVILIANMVLITMVMKLQLKDAFKVSLCTVYPVCAIIEFVLAVLTPYSFYDNWYIVSIMMILSVQICLLLILNFVSQKIK